MAPFVPFLNIGQFNIRAEINGVPMENVLHFNNGSSPWTPAGLAGTAAQVSAAWVANVMPNLSSKYVLRSIYAIDLTTQTGPTATNTDDTGATGSNGADSLPGDKSLCLSLRTDNRGRSYRGRVYIAGITKGETTDNLITASRVAAIVSGFQDFMTDLAGSDNMLVIASRFHNGIARTDGLAVVVTNVLAVNNRVTTQRRRLT
jgi:hypothetical protein